VALVRLGRSAEARDILAIDRFLHVEDLPAPPEFPSASAYYATLAEEILRNPTLSIDPRKKAIEGARQTRALVQMGDSALPMLLRQVREAIDRHVARLPAGDHPFLLGNPARATLMPWSMVSRRENTLHSHIHPSGWLRGVTYITAPKIGDAFLGPLLVGALDPDDPVPPDWPVREIEPVPGRLVLFPSFVPHATRPTDSEAVRICVAFDVEPR
jgi:Putative 2OG-Fe(II) oxygenase